MHFHAQPQPLLAQRKYIPKKQPVTYLQYYAAPPLFLVVAFYYFWGNFLNVSIVNLLYVLCVYMCTFFCSSLPHSSPSPSRFRCLLLILRLPLVYFWKAEATKNKIFSVFSV